ncbi:TIGR00730 family Rossman fold protein [bacterium]|nr:TIGR00730 family Rossman fold protein [bacterium]
MPEPGGSPQRRRACVFCGSSVGTSPVYRDTAIRMAKALVENQFDLIYGGGSIGLMGIIADTVLAERGHVTGVIPQFLATKEIMHPAVTDLHTVSSMHERKALMAELADVFIALPGGLGTYDELCEILTWAQLGLHAKPIGILNVEGFFSGLVEQIDRAMLDGFCRPEHRRLMIVATEPDELLTALSSYQPVDASKWLRPGQE